MTRMANSARKASYGAGDVWTEQRQQGYTTPPTSPARQARTHLKWCGVVANCGLPRARVRYRDSTAICLVTRIDDTFPAQGMARALETRFGDVQELKQFRRRILLLGAVNVQERPADSPRSHHRGAKVLRRFSHNSRLSFGIV
jgi:hypothetical protein